MLAEKIYHGTYRARGQRMLASNAFEESIGDRHWLGDGIYFFVEDFYAYKWIVDMYNKQYNESCRDDALIEEYMIISAGQKADARMFDLIKAAHKIEFDKTFAELKRKKEHIPRFRTVEISDGVVINYMFNELGYAQDFDLVRAIFGLNPRHYRSVFTRFGFMPQEQRCIKNPTVVEDADEYHYADNIAVYKDQIRDMYFNNVIQPPSANKVVKYSPTAGNPPFRMKRR
ncbi:hypothetical protein RB620_14665 [Paenibacillus sp. LHD-117]|uniref:hypothetical protein n=1 Tax=Paenibacillus sp. LHD-117 TaxID=3071412 RepID=UPI0027E176BD|nr:hypothetical protein [Paenibacillus sp. LHD-117]MDQ6420670.1 hypothetical protein [Paenibacillus sp. LHD-117]